MAISTVPPSASTPAAGWALPCYVSVSPKCARALGILGYWSVSAREPRGELARLLPAPDPTSGEWVSFHATTGQGVAVLVWLDATRAQHKGQLGHSEAATLAQWGRHLRAHLQQRQAAAAQGAPVPAPPARIVSRAALPKFTAEAYAAHCMSSLRELVDFAQGEAWAEGAGPWQVTEAAAP